MALTEVEEAAKSKDLDGLALSELAAAHALMAAVFAEDGNPLSSLAGKAYISRHISGMQPGAMSRYNRWVETTRPLHENSTSNGNPT